MVRPLFVFFLYISFLLLFGLLESRIAFMITTMRIITSTASSTIITGNTIGEPIWILNIPVLTKDISELVLVFYFHGKCCIDFRIHDLDRNRFSGTKVLCVFF